MTIIGKISPSGPSLRARNSLKHNSRRACTRRLKRNFQFPYFDGQNHARVRLVAPSRQIDFLIEDMKLLREGQIVGNTYEIEKFLGEGAFAEVYRVKHRFLGRQAMKVLKLAGIHRGPLAYINL